MIENFVLIEGDDRPELVPVNRVRRIRHSGLGEILVAELEGEEEEVVVSDHRITTIWKHLISKSGR